MKNLLYKINKFLFYQYIKVYYKNIFRLVSIYFAKLITRTIEIPISKVYI